LPTPRIAPIEAASKPDSTGIGVTVMGLPSDVAKGT